MQVHTEKSEQKKEKPVIQQAGNHVGLLPHDGNAEPTVQRKLQGIANAPANRLKHYQDLANGCQSQQHLPATERHLDAMPTQEPQHKQPIQRVAMPMAPPAQQVAIPANGQVIQRAVKIIGKGGDTMEYSNLDNFKRRFKNFDKFVQKLTTYGSQEKIEYHIGQMCSIDGDVKFESEEHFRQALVYDIMHKSGKDETITFQEQYMTRYGWKGRSKALKDAAASNAAASALGSGKGAAKSGGYPTKAKTKSKESASKAYMAAAAAAAAAADAGEAIEAPVADGLRIYRTMDYPEYVRVARGDYGALVGGHMGDHNQALTYLFRQSAHPKVLVEFLMKSGAERVLFNASTAFQEIESKSSILNELQAVIGAETGQESFPAGDKAQGTLSGHLGVKSEQAGDAGFSIAISGGGADKTFQKQVQGIRAIGWSTGATVLGSEAALLAFMRTPSANSNSAAANSNSASGGGSVSSNPNAGRHDEAKRALMKPIQSLAELGDLLEALNADVEFVDDVEDGYDYGQSDGAWYYGS